MADKYVSIKQVVDNITSHPLMADIPFERIVNYAVDFMRIMGAPQIFVEKVAPLTVTEYKAALPSDYFNVIQVKETKHNICLIAASDSFYSTRQNSAIHSHNVNYLVPTYKISNGYLYTSIESCTLLLAYESILTDSYGYPMLPDNSIYLKALELYVKKEWFTIQFDLNKISGAVLQNTQQEYAWAAGQCHMDMNIPTYDEMEALKNSLTSLLTKDHQHQSGFVDFGTEQHLKF